MVTQTVDITRALAIPGWMAKQELVWLAQQAGGHRCIVEIGSHLGRSTRAMLDHTDGVVYALDDWRGPRDVYLSKEERDRIPEQFKQNVSEYLGGKIVPVQGDYADIYRHWSVTDMTPDMVFIDGSHEYENVKRDITMWLPKVVKGGLICGHDAGTFPGVDKAVMELLGDVEVAEDTSIWFKYV